ncbi:MAG: glycosyltransferase [Prevotella sp.]|jgi:glycosyltransferase involved in cell wall biosynthesis|nr:glycosyltransferase [Prevotella sp.]
MHPICRVTVVMTTYNHEKYIAQAIEGVLVQKTDFPYKLLIGEDHSTDDTARIVEEFAKNYPEKIEAIIRPENIGAGNNSIDLYKRVDSEYVAVCDGDDYWIDPLKLQKQVNFLNSHPDYNTVFCRCRHLFEDGLPREDEYLPLEEVLTGYYSRGYLTAAEVIYNGVTPCNLMWRWQINNIGGFPYWYNDDVFGDIALNLIHAKTGKVGFIPEVMSVYRRHNGGMWKQLDSYDENYRNYGYHLVNTMIHLKEFFNGEEEDSFNSMIDHHFQGLFRVANKYGEIRLLIRAISEFPSEFIRFSRDRDRMNNNAKYDISLFESTQRLKKYPRRMFLLLLLYSFVTIIIQLLILMKIK